MDTQMIYELIGYLASLMVAISLMMSNIVRLRVLNMVGAGLFALYGVLISSIPVALMNGFIVLINIYYLMQIRNSEEYFKLLQMSYDSDYLAYFIKYYQDEIEQNQPDFGFDIHRDDLCVFTLRDTVPAGLLVGTITDDSVLEVKLDYVIPDYRDFKIGRFLFRTCADFFQERGVEEVIAHGGSSEHKNYLERMGFEPLQNDQSQYHLSLK